MEPKASALGANLAFLVSQVRLAVTAGTDREFLQCEELASLEVTAAQFAGQG